MGVSAFYLIIEYSGTHLTHSEAERESKSHTTVGLTEEYGLSVEVRDVVIEAWMHNGEGKHVSNSCYPTARYITIPLHCSDSDVVLVEAIRDIDVTDEVHVD